jgi:hypothetical protein
VLLLIVNGNVKVGIFQFLIITESDKINIKKHVKLTKPSPYSKRWWSTNLAKEKKKMQQLGGRSKYHRLAINHPVHEEY